MQKIGIIIDGDNKSLCVAGDAVAIVKIFSRIERFLSRTTNVKIDFNDAANIPPVAPIGGSAVEPGGPRRGNKAPVQKKKVKDGVDILTMSVDKDPADTDSTLELILNTLCKAFQMRPKQSAALLTNNNQFLIHSVVKGVKGRYEPIISWFQDLYANSKQLTMLLELEVEQIPNFANFTKVL